MNSFAAWPHLACWYQNNLHIRRPDGTSWSVKTVQALKTSAPWPKRRDRPGTRENVMLDPKGGHGS